MEKSGDTSKITTEELLTKAFDAMQIAERSKTTGYHKKREVLETMNYITRECDDDNVLVIMDSLPVIIDLIVYASKNKLKLYTPKGCFDCIQYIKKSK